MNNVVDIDPENGFIRYKVDENSILSMEEEYKKYWKNNSRTVYENPDGKKAGILGEIVFSSLFKKSIRSKHGLVEYDFILNGHKIDIKCKLRKNSPKKYFEASLFEYQKSFDVDFYVFMSTTSSFEYVWLCGYISKTGFRSNQNLVLWKVGDIDKTNGIEFKENTMSIKYSFLNQFKEKNGQVF